MNKKFVLFQRITINVLNCIYLLCSSNSLCQNYLFFLNFCIFCILQACRLLPPFVILKFLIISVGRWAKRYLKILDFFFSKTCFSNWPTIFLENYFTDFLYFIFKRTVIVCARSFTNEKCNIDWIVILSNPQKVKKWRENYHFCLNDRRFLKK